MIHFASDVSEAAMEGQIIDATVVPAPKQRNTEAEKTAIKEGRVPEGWKPAKALQKDRDARWSIKYSKAKVREGAAPRGSKAGRSRHPDVRLQEPYRHRQGAWAAPHLACPRRQRP